MCPGFDSWINVLSGLSLLVHSAPRDFLQVLWFLPSTQKHFVLIWFEDCKEFSIVRHINLKTWVHWICIFEKQVLHKRSPWRHDLLRNGHVQTLPWMIQQVSMTLKRWGQIALEKSLPSITGSCSNKPQFVMRKKIKTTLNNFIAPMTAENTLEKKNTSS